MDSGIMEITTFICPRCQQQANRAMNSGDFVHECHGQEALRNEEVLVLGDWTDYTNEGQLSVSKKFIDLNNLPRSTSIGIITGSLSRAQSFKLNMQDRIRLDSVDMLFFRDNALINNSLGSEYVFVSVRENLTSSDLTIGSIRAGLIGSTASPIGNLPYANIVLGNILLDTNKEYFIVSNFPSGVAVTGSRVGWIISLTANAGSNYPFGADYTSTNSQQSWTQNTGSDLLFRLYGQEFNVTESQSEISNQLANNLQSTRAGIEGNKNYPNRTSRGFPTNRYRTRRHRHYIGTDFFKIASEKGTDDPEEYTKST